MTLLCTVCGSAQFTSHDVLWSGLIDEWQLAPAEVRYVNAQQGKSCAICRSNLRSVALANAIRTALGVKGHLLPFIAREKARDVSILEINEAGSLSPVLSRFPGYTFAAYPQVDMHALPYPDEAFDLVVHSDTVEHVENPVHALQECRRVLKTGGALCFTVPIIVARLSRSRAGLPPSYHGSEASKPEDYMVYTEFGSDAWTYVMNAGFNQVELHAVEYPAGIAMLARKT